MARIVFAGASGTVAREIIDAILAKKKHVVIGLTQSTRARDASGIEWATIDYSNHLSLVNIMEGADFVFSCFSGRQAHDTIQNEKNLIAACIEAGVKRFVPSQWSTRSNGGVNFYAFKDEIKEYLENINRDQMVLPYTLFQVGLFTEYFATPYQTARYVQPIEMFVDFQRRRALSVGDGNFTLTLTTVADVGRVVAEALDFDGEWPTIGGIAGSQITIAEIISLGEKLRGGPFDVETLHLQDLQAGLLKSSWYPRIEQPGYTPEQIETMSKMGSLEFLRSSVEGAWLVSDEWNKLLPHLHLSTAEEYLTRVWTGKP